MAGILLAPASGIPDTVPETPVAQADTGTDIGPAPAAILTHSEVEGRVRAYFKETPILAEVARCESHFTQTSDNGSVYYGHLNHDGTHDIGVMQINDIWRSEAKKLGYDLTTLKGNLGFAKWLYDQEGLKPWMSSSLCWARAPQIADTQ